MSAPPIAYGIDFGTTNSLLSVAWDDRVDLLAIDGDSELLPSQIYLHREPLRSAGTDAVNQFVLTGSAKSSCGACNLVSMVNGEQVSDCAMFTPGGGCRDSRLISEIKRDLADPERDSTHSWAIDFDFPELVAVLLRVAKRRADRATGHDVRRLVLGHPVAFAGAQGRGFQMKQELAVKRLQMAAERAGFDEVELLEEPAAAVSLEEDEGIILAADFGGGTFDVSIIEMSADRGQVLALDGDPVGGEDIDGALFKTFLFPEFGLDRMGKGHVPNRYLVELARRSRAVRLVEDPDLPELLRELSQQRDKKVHGLRTVLYNGRMYDLYRAVEQAKCDLSSEDSTTFDFRHPGLRIRKPISRPEFEDIIQPFLGDVAATIDRVLTTAGLRPDDIDLVVTTGGSSQIPAFRSMLGHTFGEDRIQARDPYSSIALGLGMYARRLWS